MKIFKKLIATVLCMTIVASFPLVTQATEVERDNRDMGEYVTFISGNERMESDGTFEFNYRAEEKSDPFTANKDTIKIYSKCRRFNVNTGHYSTSESHEYTLTLYDSEGNEIGSYTGCANNKKTTQEFSVEKGKSYYFIITCNPNQTMPYSLNGTGKVSNVTVGT